MIKSHEWGYDDHEWFCYDKQGQVGFMTTGGYGAKPLTSCAFVAAMNNFKSIIKILTKSSDVIVVNEIGNIQDWNTMSEIGLYGFDYDYKLDKYILITKPSKPLIMGLDRTEELMQLDISFELLGTLPGSILINLYQDK